MDYYDPKIDEPWIEKFLETFTKFKSVSNGRRGHSEIRVWKKDSISKIVMFIREEKLKSFKNGKQFENKELKHQIFDIDNIHLEESGQVIFISDIQKIFNNFS